MKCCAQFFLIYRIGNDTPVMNERSSYQIVVIGVIVVGKEDLTLLTS